MELANTISSWLSTYLDKSSLNCFVIGISGGVDSALTSTLCAQTGIRTLVVSMPIHQASDQLERAHRHIDWLLKTYPNVEFLEYDLTSTFETFRLMFQDNNALALANSRSRLRMTTLYQVATTNKGLVVGTGNKVEDFGIGFFTKYGDGGVDISPIADLTKTEVVDMAKELGVHSEITEAPPTDGLWEDGRTDEDQIGASYAELELAMECSDSSTLSGRDLAVYQIYQSFHQKNLHKMIPIPIFKK